MVVADEPESLAHHLTEAGLPNEAIDYWRRAAERAVGRYANAEAISHYHRALELLAGLPATAERDRTEMLLRMGLGVPLMASMGYSAPPVQQALGRARELSRSMADGPTLFPILFGLCAYYAVKPDLPAARPLAARCLAAARRARDHGSGHGSLWRRRHAGDSTRAGWWPRTRCSSAA